MVRWDVREHISLVWFVLRWLVMVTPVAMLIGSSVAFFLWLLAEATQGRLAHPDLVYLLPFAGVAIVMIYHHYGDTASAGNNLVMEQINHPFVWWFSRARGNGCTDGWQYCSGVCRAI